MANRKRMTLAQKRAKGICQNELCNEKAHTRRLCQRCYQAALRAIKDGATTERFLIENNMIGIPREEPINTFRRWLARKTTRSRKEPCPEQSRSA